MEGFKIEGRAAVDEPASDIFAVTGGVMEAALRTAYEIVTGESLPFAGLHVEPIEGLEGVKEASIKIEKTLPAGLGRSRYPQPIDQPPQG